MSTDRVNPNLVEMVGRIASMMRDQGGSGPFSVDKAIAGALLNNRTAFERLGPEWWSAIVVDHQQGWDSVEVLTYTG